MRFAVSYIRFSTPEQRFGDSKRRQLERTEKFCQKHGLVLDKRLSDEGLSAFKGKHRSPGSALSIFLKLIDEGKVPKGTVFIIESLDRLTRESIPEALELFLGILRKGIDVVTLIDEQWYTSAKLAVDPSQLMMSIVCFWRAHDESKHKADRLREAWSAKRTKAVASNVPLSGICPGWLQISADRQRFDLIPERAKLVRLIFWLTIRGWGKRKIVKLFNSHKVPTWGVKGKAALGWHGSYIQKLLNNRAVLGEAVFYAMKDNKRTVIAAPLTTYYPQVISEADFQKVQLRGSGPRGPIGHHASNLFQGLVKDGEHPKFTMCYKDHGSNWVYLYSDHRRVNPTEPVFSWNYPRLETMLLNYLRDLDWSSLTVERDSEVRQLGDDLAKVEGKLKELDQHASRLVKLAKASSGPIREVTAELETIETDRVDLRKQGGKLKSDIAAKKGFSVTEGIDLLRELAADRAKPESRLRLRGEIRRYVERIELFRTFPEKLFKDTKLPTLKSGLAVKDFLHARCLRIVFRNGAERWIVLRGEMDGFGLRIEGRKFSRDAVLRTENPGGQFLMPASEDRELLAKAGKASINPRRKHANQ